MVPQWVEQLRVKGIDGIAADVAYRYDGYEGWVRIIDEAKASGERYETPYLTDIELREGDIVVFHPRCFHNRQSKRSDVPSWTYRLGGDLLLNTFTRTLGVWAPADAMSHRFAASCERLDPLPDRPPGPTNYRTVVAEYEARRKFEEEMDRARILHRLTDCLPDTPYIWVGRECPLSLSDGRATSVELFPGDQLVFRSVDPNAWTQHGSDILVPVDVVTVRKVDADQHEMPPSDDFLDGDRLDGDDDQHEMSPSDYFLDVHQLRRNGAILMPTDPQLPVVVFPPHNPALLPGQSVSLLDSELQRGRGHVLTYPPGTPALVEAVAGNFAVVRVGVVRGYTYLTDLPTLQTVSDRPIWERSRKWEADRKVPTPPTGLGARLRAGGTALGRRARKLTRGGDAP